jgi:general secretion pathway protein D
MQSIAKTSRRYLVTLSLGLVPAVSALAAPSFTVSSSNAFVGETIQVNVLAQSVSDLYDYQFDLNYDPTKFAFVSDGEGTFLSSTGATFFFGGTANPGSVQFVFDTLLGPGPGASGGGVLVQLNFTAIGKGVSTFSLANVIAQDSPGNLIDVGLGSAQSTVPEPGTLSLLALACAGCVVSARRKGSMSG